MQIEFIIIGSKILFTFEKLDLVIKRDHHIRQKILDCKENITAQTYDKQGHVYKIKIEDERES